jgi:hypothetical protein
MDLEGWSTPGPVECRTTAKSPIGKTPSHPDSKQGESFTARSYWLPAMLCWFLIVFL